MTAKILEFPTSPIHLKEFINDFELIMGETIEEVENEVINLIDLT